MKFWENLIGKTIRWIVFLPLGFLAASLLELKN
jgi:hypothetical protein